ncbi:MAG: S8 family serine peptidase [Actinobacteria bacterium]|nr:S8 family serine peptidase [Actinomycetota bacterium]MBV8479163.1 S8 family serine peptidase [Actinomycetota bacterium]MBV8597455.1 S8 family serine peptidase [Actinomycetota bacterium]
MRRRSLIALGAMACALAIVATAAGATPEWWLQSIGATQVTPPGPGVPIVIVDGAVDATQPSFAGRPNTTYLDQQLLIDSDDIHATAVASLAAAPATAAIAGVYPQATLALWDAGRGDSGIDAASAALGIRTAAQHCPAVINLSFGGPVPAPDVQAAILTAVRAGCLVVAAAGNSGLEGDPTMYPAAYQHVFTVGATDENDTALPFSSSGPWLDLAAPGTDMTADVPLTHDPSGVSSGLAGTSFAAPLVSAAAAWIWTVRPNLTASQVAAVLRESARKVSSANLDTKTGYGILNIAVALASPPPVPDPYEPNDDIGEVKPGLLFSSGEPPLTTATRTSNRIAGTVLQNDDPIDLYRIWVPPHEVVRVSTDTKAATSRIWGPQTVALGEPAVLRKRDLVGSSITGGAKGAYAYAEVQLATTSGFASYVLSVTASKR